MERNSSFLFYAKTNANYIISVITLYQSPQKVPINQRAIGYKVRMGNKKPLWIVYVTEMS